jgi:hypothetical protein
LRSRILDSFDTETKNKFASATYIFATNFEVDSYNKQKLLSLNQPIINITLPRIQSDFSLQLCDGARILLTRNLFLKKKLVSGIKNEDHISLHVFFIDSLSTLARLVNSGQYP